MNRFREIAHKITQEYIEAYGISFADIDQLDLMIADALSKMDDKSWQDGYKCAKEDYEVDDG